MSRPLQALGAVLRTASRQRHLRLRALARLARRRPEGLQQLLAGRGGSLADLLPLLRVLGLELTIGPRRTLHDTVFAVCALFGVSLPGLRAREAVLPHEARLGAELLGELLAQRDPHGAHRWQGTARDQIEAFRRKLQRLSLPANPPPARGADRNRSSS